MAEIDHRYTDTIVCPFCGHQMRDDDYVLDEDDSEEWDCGECEKQFEVTKHISIRYSTTPKKEAA